MESNDDVLDTFIFGFIAQHKKRKQFQNVSFEFRFQGQSFCHFRSRSLMASFTVFIAERVYLDGRFVVVLSRVTFTLDDTCYYV